MANEYVTVVKPAISVGAEDAAKMLGVSITHFKNLHAKGQCPRPVRLGRRTVWHVSELESWIAAGAPNREEWEGIKQA